MPIRKPPTGRIQRYCKYLANGLLLQKILQLLKSAGIVIEPYYFYQERLPLPLEIPDGRHFAGYEFLEVGVEHTDELAGLDPNTDTRKEIREEFSRGRRCFALRHGGKIVAASWCDTLEIHFTPCARPLAGHEAYLYHTGTMYSYRGHDVAPYLRSKIYDLLMSTGRDVLYSYTDYFNHPAVRFKEKIGARILFVGLYVKIFGLKGKNWVLSRKNSVSRPGKAAPEQSHS